VDWIPLISAILAFAGGIGGVVIGARLSARDQARHWRSQQRNEALLAFGKQADAYLRTLSSYLYPSVAGQTTANELLDAYYGLDAAGTLVEIVAPLPTRTAARELIKRVLDDIVPFTLPGTAAVPTDQASAMPDGFIQALGAFVEAARTDFGET
jgi:hypothetical protein